METLPLNTIVRGDCLQVLAGLPSRSVDLVFADPPYNLQLQNALLRPNHTEVDAVDDAWDQFADFAAYDDFTRQWLTECRRILKDNGTIWVIGSYHNIYRVGSIMLDLGYWVLNDIVWVKTNPMPNFRGVRFTNAHETLLWCKKSKEQRKYTFNYQAMKADNNGLQMRSDWEIPICSGSERLLDAAGRKIHSTQKPEKLLQRVIMSSTNVGDVLLDPFFGTGTSGAVAKKLGRSFIGIEREPRYIQAAQARIDAITPLNAQDAAQLARQEKKQALARIPFAALLKHQMLEAGQRLYFKGQKRRYAIITAEGHLRAADGQTGSIHKLGAIFANQPSCNGWEHWYYDSGDSLRPIDDLRARLRSTPQPVE